MQAVVTLIFELEDAETGAAITDREEYLNVANYVRHTILFHADGGRLLPDHVKFSNRRIIDGVAD